MFIGEFNILERLDEPIIMAGSKESSPPAKNKKRPAGKRTMRDLERICAFKI